ncbi:Hemolysin-type calcium-binding repeat (2 copies), partial [Snodgrassella alvi SCGC AB-598-J21]
EFDIDNNGDGDDVIYGGNGNDTIYGEGTGQVFQQFLGSVSHLLTWHTVFMFATALIVAMGVGAGLERSCKVMMPGLGLLLIGLVVYAAVVSGPSFGKAFAFLFTPNWSAITG